MKKIDTQAYVAEQAVEKILSVENHVYRPWQLSKHELEPQRLVSAKDEFARYLEVDAFVRPGFEVKDNRVSVSHLFCKVDGDCRDIIRDIEKLKESNSERIAIHKSFNLINSKPRTAFFAEKPSWFNDETGEINVAEAQSQTLTALGQLRPSYRQTYLEAVNRVMKAVREGELLINPPTPRVMLETLIYNSTLIVDMFHHFDYQYMVPKFIIEDRDNKTPNAYAALRLLLMNELSFDILVCSEEAYSSIENIIEADNYELYILGSGPKPKPRAEKASSASIKNKVLIWLFIVAIVVGIWLLALDVIDF